MSAQTPAQLPQFDAATKKELEEFLEQEQAKAKIQASVHELTNICMLETSNVAKKLMERLEEVYTGKHFVEVFSRGGILP